jgi:poly(3-hydroxybutyrate) depolymerase
MQGRNRELFSLDRTVLAACGLLTLFFCDGCGSNTHDSNNGGGSGAGGTLGTGGSPFNASGGSPSSTGSGGSFPGSSGGGAAGTVGSGGFPAAGGQGQGGIPSEGGSTGVGGTTGTGGQTTAPDDAAGTACTKQITPSMDCSAPLAPGDDKSCMVGTRQYYLYAPKNFNVCKPAALVIDAHGATQTAESQLLGTPPFCIGAGTCWNGPGSGWRLEAEAPDGGFILVTPSSATSGNTWDPTTDPPVMMQIIDAVKKVATIDPKRIYFTGISNGAELSYWTACANPGVFAGISPNSGGVMGGAQCNTLSVPQSDIQFDDMPDFAFSDSQSTVTNMAKTDNCKEGPIPWKTIDSTTTDPICLKDPDDNATTLVPCNTITPAVMPTTCQLWDQCDGGTKVVFCQVAAGILHGAANAAIDGHIIYENSTHLNTPSLAWRFFQGLK